jgi:hypothetical protein
MTSIRAFRLPGHGAWSGILLLLLSLALNCFLIAHELPETSHPDEPKTVRRAMAMGTGDLNPHFFRYPTLWIYMVFAAQGTAVAAGLGLGLLRGMDSLPTLASTNPTIFYLAGRILAAVLGAGSVEPPSSWTRRRSPTCFPAGSRWRPA